LRYLGCVMTDKKIDKFQIAEILGVKDQNFAIQKGKTDPSFPAPCDPGTTQRRTLWWKNDILEYKKNFKLRGKGNNGSNPVSDELTLDNVLAQKFIRLCGRYWLANYEA